MLASWQWIADRWTDFDRGQDYFWFQIGMFGNWVASRPDWWSVQTPPVQGIWASIYALLGVLAAWYMWRDRWQDPFPWRIVGSAAFGVTWGPIASFTAVFLAAIIFYIIWIYVGISALVVGVYGTLFEGGWKLITAPFS